MKPSGAHIKDSPHFQILDSPMDTKYFMKSFAHLESEMVHNPNGITIELGGRKLKKHFGKISKTLSGNREIKRGAKQDCVELMKTTVTHLRIVHKNTGVPTLKVSMEYCLFRQEPGGESWEQFKYK